MRFVYDGKSYMVNDSEWESYLRTARANIEIPDGVELTDDDKEYIEEIAKEILLEDRGVLVNEEQQNLIEETKGQRRENASAENKPKREKKPQKDDDDKIFLINLIAQALEDEETVSEVNIANKQKLIEFEYNGKPYTLDLKFARNKFKARG